MWLGIVFTTSYTSLYYFVHTNINYNAIDFMVKGDSLKGTQTTYRGYNFVRHQIY